MKTIKLTPENFELLKEVLQSEMERAKNALERFPQVADRDKVKRVEQAIEQFLQGGEQ